MDWSRIRHQSPLFLPLLCAEGLCVLYISPARHGGKCGLHSRFAVAINHQHRSGMGLIPSTIGQGTPPLVVPWLAGLHSPVPDRYALAASRVHPRRRFCVAPLLRGRALRVGAGAAFNYSRRGDDRRVVCDASFYVLSTALTILIWGGPARAVSRHTGQVLVHLISESAFTSPTERQAADMRLAFKRGLRIPFRFVA